MNRDWLSLIDQRFLTIILRESAGFHGIEFADLGPERGRPRDAIEVAIAVARLRRLPRWAILEALDLADGGAAFLARHVSARLRWPRFRAEVAEVDRRVHACLVQATRPLLFVAEAA